MRLEKQKLSSLREDTDLHAWTGRLNTHAHTVLQNHISSDKSKSSCEDECSRQGFNGASFI